MFQRTISKIAMLLVCATGLLTSCKEENADLRFRPGNSNYELTYTIDRTGMKEGKKSSDKQGATLQLAMSGDSSLINVKATYKRYWANMRSTTDSFLIDTDKPIKIDFQTVSSIVPGILQEVKGESFDFTFNSLGRIGGMTSFTPMITSITRKVMPADQAENLELYSNIFDLANGHFSPQAANAVLQPIFPEFPGRPLKLADTLNDRTYHSGDGYPMTIVQMTKVAEITKESVTLLVGGSGFSTASIDGNLKLEQQGKIVVNRQTGVIESAYIENFITGKVDKFPVDLKIVTEATCKRIP